MDGKISILIVQLRIKKEQMKDYLSI